MSFQLGVVTRRFKYCTSIPLVKSLIFLISIWDGLPLSLKKLSRDNIQSIIDAIMEQLLGWKADLTFRVGRRCMFTFCWLQRWYILLWQYSCRPLELDGLGISNFTTLSRALRPRRLLLKKHNRNSHGQVSLSRCRNMTEPSFRWLWHPKLLMASTQFSGLIGDFMESPLQSLHHTCMSAYQKERLRVARFKSPPTITHGFQIF
jgi:hypothetical protein